MARSSLLFRRLFSSLFLAAASLLFWPPTGAHAQQSSEVNGTLVVEAEGFTTNNSPRSDHSWTAMTATPGFSGTGYMEAMPNSGATLAAGTDSPELQYTVTFTNSGTFQIWIRGQAPTDADDSVWVAVDSGTAVPVTLTATNAWQWSNRNHTTGTSATVAVTAGTRTLRVWMREDGLKLDRILLTRNAGFAATTGNAWHIPNNTEPAGVTAMRAPVIVQSPASVSVFSGNQFQGTGGNPGNQTQTGSTVYYRKTGTPGWSSAAMTFHSEAANNKYYGASIPTSGFGPGDRIEYYLRIPYTDHIPTFLYGNDSSSSATEIESVAQASPHAFVIQWPLTPSGSSVSHESGGHRLRVYENSGHFTVSGPDLAGTPMATEVVFPPPTIKINDRGHIPGPVLSSTEIPDGLEWVQSLNGTDITSRLTFTGDGIARFEVVDWNGIVPTQTIISSPSDASEHFYGFGEKFNSIDQAGNRVNMLTWDQPGTKGDRSYKVVPWFLSTRGYGFHLDSSAESWFDMRKTSADRYFVQNLYRTLAFNIVWGPKFTDALSRFTGYVGRPPLPPQWAFGTWISSDIWRTGGEVRYFVNRYLQEGIPASVVVFDSPWEIGYNDFFWNTSQWAASGTYEGVTYPGFASIADMMNFLRARGFKVICWMTPFVNINSVTDSVGGQNVPGQNTGQAQNYAEGAANGYFVRQSPGGPPLVVPWWKGNGSPVDFTSPDARAWFTAQLQRLIDESVAGGTEPVIGGFKTDDGETSNGSDMYIPLSASYSDGRTGVEMRNGFCVEYHRTVWNVLGTNGILFARGGFTGTQAFPAGWGGDNLPNFGADNGMQSVIVSGLSAAMSGYSIWGHDIGGYLTGGGVYESNPADLFMRWTQFGAFSPLMQLHRQISASDLRQYPWGYTTTALNNYRDYARLHHQLFPYIYSYARKSADTGIPIMRPLVLMNQTDTNTYGVKHTYYFGDEFVVAPVVALNTTSRNVYLPAGQWRDFWTGALHTGAQNVNWSNADPSKFPVFVREGSVIPMLLNTPQTLCSTEYVNNPAISTPDGNLEVRVYPAGTTNFTMYDGTTFAAEKGATTAKITFNSVPRTLVFKFFGSAPAGAERDGIRLPQVAGRSALESAESGWFHDAASGFTHVKVTHGGGVSTVSLGGSSAGDGITDSWKQAWGVTDADADDDGDGRTNLQEYLAGTSPVDPGSRFQISGLTRQVSGGNPAFVVSWPSQPGISYGIQWKQQLAGPSWQTLLPAFQGTGGTLQWTDDGSQTAPLTTASRFYQVIVR